MKTGGTQVEVPKKRHTNLMKVGDIMECTYSASCGYTVGGRYEVVEDDSGFACLVADDGLYDYPSLLVSKFKKVE